jgi:hypothetical protein
LLSVVVTVSNISAANLRYQAQNEGEMKKLLLLSAQTQGEQTTGFQALVCALVSLWAMRHPVDRGLSLDWINTL